MSPEQRVRLDPLLHEPCDCLLHSSSLSSKHSSFGLCPLPNPFRLLYESPINNNDMKMISISHFLFNPGVAMATSVDSGLWKAKTIHISDSTVRVILP